MLLDLSSYLQLRDTADGYYMGTNEIQLNGKKD